MVKTLADDSPSYSTTKKWAASFKQERESTEDDPWSGCPEWSTTDNQVETIHHIVINDRRVTIPQIVNTMGISYGSD